MNRTYPLALALALSAVPAAAFDPGAMSEAERAAFGAAVREYLLSDPGFVYDMLATVERTRITDAAANDLAELAAAAPDLFASPGDPVLGNPDGDVTLAYFTDHRCPFCRATEADLAALIAEDPELRIVVKHYPILTPESRTAAAFALAVNDLAGAEAYATAHDRLYGLRGGFTPASLGALATDLGLASDQVLARMESAEVAARIDANLALGQRFGLDATPSFVLPKLLVRGQVPGVALKGYIDAAR